MKVQFICTRKAGQAFFTVVLEPVDDANKCATCGDKGVAGSFCQKDGGLIVAGDRSVFVDTPHANIFMTALTPEAGALFAEGKVVTIDFGV